jgi:hypothetical protein
MLFKRSNNTVTKTSLMVIAYLTESYKIRFQTNDFIHNGFISPRNNGSLLPDVPLQYGEAIIRPRLYESKCHRHQQAEQESFHS